MPIPDKYANIELELQCRYFKSEKNESLGQIFDKYSVAYFDKIYSRRRPYLFRKVAVKFKTPEEFRRYVSSIFLYHPDIKSAKDFNRVNIEFIDPEDKVNIACYTKFQFHLDQLDLGFTNDCEEIFRISDGFGVTFEQWLMSDWLFSSVAEKKIRYESIAVLNKISPFVEESYSNLSQLRKKIYEMEARRLSKLSGLLELSEKSLGGYRKLVVDIKEKMR